MRAVAGGVLVGCAMLGVLVAPGGAEGAAEHYLVADADLAPGAAVAASEVRRLPLRLPPALARHAVRRLDEIEGRPLRVTVPAGSLLHTGQFAAEGGAPGGGVELSVALPRRRALDGSLSVGDTLALVATYGTGTAGHTQVVADRATVLEVGEAGSGLGADPEIGVRLQVRRSDDVLAVVHAAHADALSLVRPTGAGPGVDEHYRPSTPPPGEGG